MAITRIGTAAAADGTTITIPAGHQAGDMIMIYAFRNAVTSPSLPAGWTNITSGSAGATSFRMGYKIAISNADTSGTWTNATGLVVVVYRGTTTAISPVGKINNNTATSATVAYPTLNPLQQPGSSWVVAFAGVVGTTSTVETPPTNLTNFVNTVGAAIEYAGHDSNGAYTAGQGIWPSTNVGVTLSSEHRSMMVEILAEQGVNNNYQFVKAPDGISVTEKIR